MKLESKIVVALGLFIAFSTIVFHLFSELSLVNALYFIIATMTTIGYGDINLLGVEVPLKLFGLLVMVMGAAFTAVIYGVITNFIVGTQLQGIFGRAETKMKNHTILIGWNKTAKATLEEIRKISDVTILTRDDEVPKKIEGKNVDVIVGDATDEEVLLKARVNQARTVITCDDDDSKNIMTTLMVRRLNRDVKIISSAHEVSNMVLITQAGANEVISPDVIGGRLITSAIFEPNVVRMIKDATFVGEGTNIEEIKMRSDTTVRDIQDTFRISVLEKVDTDENRHPSLTGGDKIMAGELAIVFGEIENIRRAREELE